MKIAKPLYCWKNLLSRDLELYINHTEPIRDLTDTTSNLQTVTLDDYKDICVASSLSCRGEVIKCRHFPQYWPFVRGIHRSPVNSQRPVTQSFDVFFDLRLNKRLSRSSKYRWFETPSRPLWDHSNVNNDFASSYISGWNSKLTIITSQKQVASGYWKHAYLPDWRCSIFPHFSIHHYNDVIMGAIASQITSLTIAYSDADQRKHQSSASLAFVRGIHRWPVNSPHKWQVTRKMFPFDDVIMAIGFSSATRLFLCWKNTHSKYTQ